MVEFLKSKRTSFVNKPVGVVAADTGARQLGLAVAEFGNSMQKIFWEEARQDAVKGDVEKANTLAIRDEQGRLKFEKPNFSRVGGGKANAILRERYGNEILIKSKQKFGELHAEYTRDGKFDKEGFDLAANSYIKGHTDSFKENGFEEFIPAFLSKVQNQAVLHSNKILNDKIDQENRIANENEKIIIDEQIQELEGLYYNKSSVTSFDEEGAADNFAEDIAETENEILQRIESLKGRPNGLAAPAIKELKRKMRINSSLGVLQSIIDKNPTDDKAIKILEMAFQGNTLSGDQRAYLLLSNNPITESDLIEAQQLKDKFNYTYSDRATISGLLSNFAGDAAENNQKLSESMKALNSSQKIGSGGFHTNSKPSRQEFQLGLEQKYGALDLRSFLTMPKDKYEAVLADLRTSTILPQSLYEAFKNTNIMAMFEGMPMQSRQTIAAKLLNTWNNISKRQDAGGIGVVSRYPTQYNDIEKKFNIIKKITDIGGADYILPAYEIAMMSPETKEDSDKLIMSYNEQFDLNATKPADVINALLTESDIDKQFHQEYFSFTKALLFAGKLKDTQGKSVEFSKDNIIEVLNDTFNNLHEEDDGETFQLYGNVLGGRTNVSYKNYYKNQGSRNFFTDYVNNLVQTQRTYTPEMMETATEIEPIEYMAGSGGNVKYLPDYRNSAGSSMVWNLVDENKVPIVGFDGVPLQVSTEDVDRSLQIHLEEQNKAILAKNFRSTQLTDDNINQLINSVNASPNIMEIRGIGEQYYGINPRLDEALVNKGYRISGPVEEDEVDQIMIVPEENIYTKGLNKLLGFFDQQSFNITSDNIKKNFPELGSKGTQNPAWRYVYNEVIKEANVSKELKKAIDENFDEDVAIQIVDDSVDVLSYLGNIEGFKSHGYADGTGENATISIGAGFNLKYFTDEDMAVLSDKGKAHVNELKTLLKKRKSGDITLQDIEEYSKKQGESITEVESQQIFRNKVLDIYKKFTNEFPNFTTLHSDRQKALIDHAYQMGYGQGKFKKYWKEVSAALKTTNPRNRDYHFMMAGSHLLYNYNNESQEGMSNTFVTGETILNKQFQSYGPIGNDRIYDRAELLGYVDRNRPSFIDKAMVLGGKVYNRAASEIRKM